MENLLLIAIVIVLLIVIALLKRRISDLARSKNRAELERDIYSQIVRESNIHGVPPKDLGKDENKE